RTDALENTGDRFQVVRKNLWTCFEYFLQQIRFAREIWGEVFYTGVGIELVNLAHDLCVEPRALVGQIITSDTRDRCGVKIYLVGIFREAACLVGIQSLRFTSGNIAEITTTGTAISADEEGRFSGLPAFMDIWTTCLLANRMQAGTRNTLLHVLIT